MNSLATVFELSSSKNCFLAPKSSRRKPDKKNTGAKLAIYETSLNGKCAYFSVSGDGAELRSGDCVTINGLYAAKLGIKDRQEVILKPVDSPLTAVAEKVYVEPLTVDDWEILERSAAQIEYGLLDQVRVVWPSQIIPVWVERSICIFIVVASVNPCSDKSFSVLDNTTMVIVAPKVRSENLEPVYRSTTLKIPKRQNATDRTGDTPPFVGTNSVDSEIRKFPDFWSVNKVSRRKKRNSRSDPALTGEIDRRDPWQLRRRHTDKVRKSTLMEIVSSFWGYQTQSGIGIADQSEDEDVNDKLSHTPQEDPVPPDNLVYRVQSADLPGLYDSLQARYARLSMEDELDGDRHQAPAELLQPSTIYVTMKDILDRKLGGLTRKTTPRVYYAELRKILSPLDREKAQAEAKKNTEKKTGKDQTASPGTNEDSQFRCYVRVVTVNRSVAASPSSWQQAALAVLAECGLAKGHAVIPSEVRRHLFLDVTGCVWLKASQVKFTEPGAIVLFPISIIPRALDNKNLIAAFKSWVEMVADDEHPLVIYHGMLVRFKVTPAVTLEAQVLLGSGKETASLLSKSKLKQATVIVQREVKEDLPLPGVVEPLLTYRVVDDFDHHPPNIHLDHLGGVSSFTSAALKHLEACCCIRPLPRQLFGDRPGLNHGLLLVTGPKGSGKTSLAAALCHAATTFPTLAFTLILDCKALRGKRIDAIRTLLEAAFDEVAWRQPSVLVLDDLDVIAPASDNPGTEMSQEALYAALVSEVLQDLVKFEMCNLSRMALIVTSQSRSSLHASIVASRGRHLVQEVITIKPPDKVCRKELLLRILERHSTVLANETMKRINLDSIVSRTEGFVARDMQVLVSRALHCHLTVTPSAEQKSVTLTEEDFDGALEGFKPLAIRNVLLHTHGDLGWADVGGLEAVKTALVETLHWPSKYPELFANCPLRLRSGLLLFGPPGTGKTLLAGAVAKECCCNFISIKGPELLSKYIGASEQAVRDLFTRARSAKPCILFFDEFDSIAPKRGHDSTGVTDRVVNQLLTLLDGVEGLQGVFVLGATSRPDLIDPALLRPGRFDKCLYCNIPTQIERRSILAALTQKMYLCDDVDLDEIADVCENFTGADFKALLYNAQLQAIHEYSDTQKLLNNNLVHFKGSPTSCSMVNKMSPITISARKSSLMSGASPPSINIQPDMMLDTVKLTSADGPKPASEMIVPGPGGDATVAMVQTLEAARIPERRNTQPPSLLDVVDGDGNANSHKKSVTFIPKMGDAPAVLTPEDEARFLTMVQTIHRRHGQQWPKTYLDKRRASSVVAKPSVLLPVTHSHLLAAANSIRPSVSAAERLRYQAIYENFISGREGNFQTGYDQTGMRTTLA